MIKRRLAALAVVALVAAACGDSDDDSDTTEASSEETAATEPASSDPTDTSGSSVAPDVRPIDPEGHLRYGYSIRLPQWDPIFSTISQDNVYLSAVYDRLVHHSTAGELIPGLATEWAVSDDGLTWTFTLREGVTFHDGTPFDAEAVRANLERAQTTEGSTVAPELAPVAEITVVDPLTIELAVSAPAPELPAVLSDRAGMMASPAAFDALAHQPVGAGMFSFRDEVPDTSATLDRYDAYWEPEAVQLASLTIVALPDSATRVNALRSGQIDWAAVPAQDYERLLAEPNLEGDVFDSISYLSLTVYRARPPLDDVRVRQALSHAIDRSVITEALLLGFATPCSQGFPEGYVAHVEALGCDTFPFDQERAKELLAEAGHGDGLSLSMQVSTAGDGLQQAEAIQAQLAEVGIELEVVPVDVSRFVAGFFIEGNYDMSLGLWGGRASAFQSLQILYTSDGALNPGKAPAPEFDEAFNAARNEVDPEQQTELLREATAMAIEDQYDIPLWFVPYQNVWNADLVGAEGYLMGKQEFRGVGIAAD